MFNAIQRFDRSETFQIISRLQYRSNAAGYARPRWESRVQKFADGSKRSATEKKEQLQKEEALVQNITQIAKDA